MEKAIKKLLSKTPLTGDEAGRIMILDLLAAYQNLLDGGSGGVLSDSEKLNIVNGLDRASDMQRFNDYKGVHDFLTTAGAVYESYAKTFEVYYWRIIHILNLTKYAEEELRRAKQRPVIMTRAQYDSFMQSGEPAPSGGIAVLQDVPSHMSEGVGENGPGSAQEPYWRDLFVSEAILRDHSGLIIEILDGMKDMLAECCARKKALEMIGRFVKVPQVKVLAIPVDEEKVTILNNLMDEIIKNVSGRSDALAASLSLILTPIDTASLEPTPESVVKARRVLSFPFIKNSSEAFTAMLKRELRNDCRQ